MRNEASVARSSSRLSRMVVGLSLAATMVVGCGDPNTVQSMTVYPVSGKLLLKDDKPLTTGQIVFVSPSRGMEFASPVGSDGTFKMTSTFGEGIPDGDYLVRIDPSPTEVAAAKKPGGKAAWSHPYPPKYGDESTSDLKVTVKPGDNAIEPLHLVEGPGIAKSKAGKGGRGHED